MKTQTFIFVGRSGSGKGTQLELLKEYLLLQNKNTPIKSIIMGDIFRSFFKSEGYVQKIAKQVTEDGKFQPNFLTDALFVHSAIDIVDEESILFFDGYPRNSDQLEIIEELLKYIKRQDPVVINIEVSRENVKERMLSRGRSDDTLNAIESRLDEYDKFILPMLKILKNDSFFRYVEIDGEGNKEEIHNNIIKFLNI